MLRFLPSFSSRIAALSPSGQMEILETQALSTANFLIYQVTSNGSESRAFDVSSSCHQLAFGDETGTLNLFSSNPTSMFNPFSRGTEFPDPVEQFTPISFNMEDVNSPCLSSVPLPFVTQTGLGKLEIMLIEISVRFFNLKKTLQGMKLCVRTGRRTWFNPGIAGTPRWTSLFSSRWKWWDRSDMPRTLERFGGIRCSTSLMPRAWAGGRWPMWSSRSAPVPPLWWWGRKI